VPGAFGGYVVQLAAAEALHVLADAGPRDEELVRSLGADEVVRRGDDVTTLIRELVPDGVHGLADGAVLERAVLAERRPAASCVEALLDQAYGGCQVVGEGTVGPLLAEHGRCFVVHPTQR
jgi:hypothetical protein